MSNEIEARFERLLSEHLIPEFCSDSNRSCVPSGYIDKSAELSLIDKELFLKGYELGLFVSDGQGRYRSPNGGSVEQFFWEGRKDRQPRQFSLWLEPIISVGALAQLHEEFGWPLARLEAQSRDYAFDFLVTEPSGKRILIAGEVKKSVRECDKLIELMMPYGADPDSKQPEGKLQINAWRKAKALRHGKIPIFWLVGPSGYRRAFSASYEIDGAFSLCERDQSLLSIGQIFASGPSKSAHRLRLERARLAWLEGRSDTFVLARLANWAEPLAKELGRGAVTLDDLREQLEIIAEIGCDAFKRCDDAPPLT